MYALFAMRKMMLLSRINMYQQRLMRLAQDQMDLATYGANMQDGVVTPDEWVNTPPSMLHAQLYDGNFIKENAKRYAAFMSQNVRNTGMGNIHPLYFMKTYMQQMGQNLSKKIAIAENKIAMEKTRIETQLKAANQEMESLDKAEDEAIKRSAPKYA